MEHETLRLFIRAKLADGFLPNAGIPRLWGGPGTGQPCDACEKVITKAELEFEGPGPKGDVVRFHIGCFGIWDTERQSEGHQPSRPK